MKKLFVSLSLVAFCAVSVVAQQLKKTVEVKEDEVPVAVRVAFQHDFNLTTDEGNWKLTYEVSSEGQKSIATPLVYSYAKKNEGKKIEVRYTPEGKLTSFKGVDKVIESTSASDNKEKS